MHAVTMPKELQNPRHIQSNGLIDRSYKPLQRFVSAFFMLSLAPSPHAPQSRLYQEFIQRSHMNTNVCIFYFIHLFWSGFNLASSLMLTPGEQHVWIQQKNCWSCAGYDWHTCRTIEIPEGEEDKELYLQNDDNKSSPNWRDEEIQQFLVV